MLKKHPPFTVYGANGGRKELTDYIFHNPYTMRVLRYLDWPHPVELDLEDGGLPNKMFPSEHLRL